MIARYWPIVAVVLATILFAAAILYLAKSARESSYQAGRADQQVEASGETIKRIERADNAAETIKHDPDARLDLCMRHARNPDDC